MYNTIVMKLINDKLKITYIFDLIAYSDYYKIYMLLIFNNIKMFIIHELDNL
jgi:hypothetical protein